MSQFEKWQTDAASDDPQQSNERWWNDHPMAFDWDLKHSFPEGSAEYFAQIDQRFFSLIEHVAHRGWPEAAPFSSLEDFRLLAGKQVLEIGCGAGSAAEVLARSGCELTAIDLTQRAVDLTTRRLNLAGLAVKVVKMDAEKMTFEDESFDYIWSWGVIHHSSHPERIVKEMFRVLRPGGHISIMVYHKMSTRYWVSGVLRRGILVLGLLKKSPDEIQMEITDGFFARHYTRKEVKGLFAQFSDVTVRTFDMSDLAIPSRFLRGLLRSVLGNERYWGLVRRVESRFGWELFLSAAKKR